MTPVTIAERLRAAAERGRLSLQRCARCERAVWFPRVACPHCHADALEWTEDAGDGTLATYAIVRRPHAERYREHVPIVLAVLELDAGCQMIASVVGDDRLQVAAGDRVRPATAGRWSELPQFVRCPSTDERSPVQEEETR